MYSRRRNLVIMGVYFSVIIRSTKVGLLIELCLMQQNHSGESWSHSKWASSYDNVECKKIIMETTGAT